MKKQTSNLVILLSLFLIGSILTTSCGVKKDPPSAVITVYKLSSNGEEIPVINCEVSIDPPPGATQPEILEYANKIKLTGPDGKVEYQFKYEGVLTVKAKYNDVDETCGKGVLILKNGEVYHESIRLTAC